MGKHGLIVFLFLTSISSFCLGPPSEAELVTKAAEKYGKSAIGAEDYIDFSEVYNLLSKEAKPLIFENWANRKISEKRRLAQKMVSFEFSAIENPEVNGDEATVDIKYKRNSRGFSETKSKTITLIKEDGAWKIAQDVSF